MTSSPPPARSAAFFDLDKTVIATSSATALARPFLRGGLLTRRAMLRSAFAQAAFLLGSADEGNTERLRVALSRTVAGWDVVRVEELIDAYVDRVIRPVLHREAVELIAEHHAAGQEVVIVSASAQELVRPIARLLGVDQVIATRMQVVDGRYTGQIESYVYGEAKATAMRALAHERGYDLAASTAYSDSATDAPMLAAVGHGFMVNPDRRLRRWAAQQGWQTLTFHRVGAEDRTAGRTTGLRRIVVAGTVLAFAAALLWQVVLLRTRSHRAATRSPG